MEYYGKDDLDGSLWKYCQLCNIKFTNRNIAASHAQSALHKKNESKLADATKRMSNRGGDSEQSSAHHGAQSHMPQSVPSKTAYRGACQHALQPDCKACKVGGFRVQSFWNEHVESDEHCSTILKHFYSLEQDKFFRLYGDVPYSKEKDVSEKSEYKTDIEKHMAVRSGILNFFECRLCDSQTQNIRPWMSHITGKKHIMRCVESVQRLGLAEHIKQYGDIPLPRGGVFEENLQKFNRREEIERNATKKKQAAEHAQNRQRTVEEHKSRTVSRNDEPRRQNFGPKSSEHRDREYEERFSRGQEDYPRQPERQKSQSATSWRDQIRKITGIDVSGYSKENQFDKSVTEKRAGAKSSNEGFRSHPPDRYDAPEDQRRESRFDKLSRNGQVQPLYPEGRRQAEDFRYDERRAAAERVPQGQAGAPAVIQPRAPVVPPQQASYGGQSPGYREQLGRHPQAPQQGVAHVQPMSSPPMESHQTSPQYYQGQMRPSAGVAATQPNASMPPAAMAAPQQPVLGQGVPYSQPAQQLPYSQYAPQPQQIRYVQPSAMAPTSVPSQMPQQNAFAPQQRALAQNASPMIMQSQTVYQTHQIVTPGVPQGGPHPMAPNQQPPGPRFQQPAYGQMPQAQPPLQQPQSFIAQTVDFSSRLPQPLAMQQPQVLPQPAVQQSSAVHLAQGVPYSAPQTHGFGQPVAQLQSAQFPAPAPGSRVMEPVVYQSKDPYVDGSQLERREIGQENAELVGPNQPAGSRGYDVVSSERSAQGSGRHPSDRKKDYKEEKSAQALRHVHNRLAKLRRLQSPDSGVKNDTGRRNGRSDRKHGDRPATPDRSAARSSRSPRPGSNDRRRRERSKENAAQQSRPRDRQEPRRARDQSPEARSRRYEEGDHRSRSHSRSERARSYSRDRSPQARPVQGQRKASPDDRELRRDSKDRPFTDRFHKKPAISPHKIFSEMKKRLDTQEKADEDRNRRGSRDRGGNGGKSWKKQPDASAKRNDTGGRKAPSRGDGEDDRGSEKRQRSRGDVKRDRGDREGKATAQYRPQHGDAVHGKEQWERRKEWSKERDTGPNVDRDREGGSRSRQQLGDRPGRADQQWDGRRGRDFGQESSREGIDDTEMWERSPDRYGDFERSKDSLGRMESDNHVKMDVDLRQHVSETRDDIDGDFDYREHQGLGDPDQKQRKDTVVGQAFDKQLRAREDERLRHQLQQIKVKVQNIQGPAESLLGVQLHDTDYRGVSSSSADLDLRVKDSKRESGTASRDGLKQDYTEGEYREKHRREHRESSVESLHDQDFRSDDRRDTRYDRKRGQQIEDPKVPKKPRKDRDERSYTDRPDRDDRSQGLRDRDEREQGGRERFSRDGDSGERSERSRQDKDDRRREGDAHRLPHDRDERRETQRWGEEGDRDERLRAFSDARSRPRDKDDREQSFGEAGRRAKDGILDQEVHCGFINMGSKKSKTQIDSDKEIEESVDMFAETVQQFLSMVCDPQNSPGLGYSGSVLMPDAQSMVAEVCELTGVQDMNVVSHAVNVLASLDPVIVQTLGMLPQDTLQQFMSGNMRALGSRSTLEQFKDTIISGRVDVQALQESILAYQSDPARAALASSRNLDRSRDDREKSDSGSHHQQRVRGDQHRSGHQQGGRDYQQRSSYRR